MQKNDVITLTIIDITAEGSGVGRHEGMAVFVPLTTIGDTARVKILKVKKTYAYAKLEELVTPSPDRTSNYCPTFTQCGGCVFRHISYEAECRIKYNRVYETMKRIGGIDIKPMPIISAVRTERYRNKAQYPVGVGGIIGFYAVHSHRIVKCDGCDLQPLIFDRITLEAAKWVKENNISVYDETTHKGILRHIYLRLAEKTDEIMFTAVINGEKLPCPEDLIERLIKVCGKNLKSVQININREDTNVILGETCWVIYGEPYIHDILCGVKIRLSPLSFYQVNRDMAELLYKKAAEYASPEGKTILDLFCGAGTIGLSMADRAKNIIGVEIIPEAVKDAKYNAQANGITNAEFICADAKAAALKLAEENVSPDVVIVDPPRKGCSAELIDTITSDFSPDTIVYVSCDPATLARDVKLLVDKGYTLIEYTPVDLFPRTSHVECVTLMSRVKE